MCGRFTFKFTWAEIYEQLSGYADALDDHAKQIISEAPPRFNIAPTQPIIVFKRRGSDVEAQLMRWGLVPEWVKDPRDFPLIVNARAETMKEKPSFRNALKNRRCVIPASGYYEWLRNDGAKIPHYITNKDDSPMLFAGLYSTWMGPDGEEIDTATIITVPANAELAEIHDRSPALLTGQAVTDWLDEANINSDKAHKLLQSVPLGTTKAHPVSQRVNSARNEGEDLIEPVFEGAEVQQSKPEKSEKKDQLDLF